MMHKFQCFATVLVTGILAAVSVAAAQGTDPMPKPTPSEQHETMMNSQGKADPSGMMGMMTGMMSGMDAAQMKQMMESCNRMMGAMAPAPAKPE